MNLANGVIRKGDRLLGTDYSVDLEGKVYTVLDITDGNYFLDTPLNAWAKSGFPKQPFIRLSVKDYIGLCR